jgi:hypothetical protein
MRQMIVDVAPHAIDLLMDIRGNLFLARRSQLLGQVREHGQRRLQTLRKIAGLGRGACNMPIPAPDLRRGLSRRA